MDSPLLELLGGDPALYPHRLANDFPHVAQRLVKLWGDGAIYRFLDSLTPADPGPSRGFPPEVRAEIERLRRYYLDRFPEPEPEPEPDAGPETGPEAGPGPTPVAAPTPPGLELVPLPAVEHDEAHDIWRGERSRKL